MRILLIGGAGYVGSACLRWLLNEGYEPFAFDNLSTGHAAAVPDKRLIVGDIQERQAVEKAILKCGAEAVMHFAAVASVPKSIAAPEAYWRINVLGTKNVLDAMRATGVKNLVFSSTAAVYSFAEPMPIDEGAQLKPSVPYGKTKLAAEGIIEDYAKSYGVRYVILRYFNACGADSGGKFGEARSEEEHLIPLVLLTAMERRKTVLVYGGDWDTPDGSCVRDFIHIEDLALAHQLAIETIAFAPNEIYNLGTGCGTTVLQVIQACEMVVGCKIPHKIVERRAGDPSVLVASAAKAKRLLGWSPRYTDIREIIETAWQWHRSHPDGYGSGACTNS